MFDRGERCNVEVEVEGDREKQSSFGSLKCRLGELDVAVVDLDVGVVDAEREEIARSQDEDRGWIDSRQVANGGVDRREAVPLSADRREQEAGESLLYVTAVG